MPLLIILFSIVFLFPAHASSFPDVPGDAWYAPYVEEVSEQGIMHGYPNGRYGSWDPVNRAELSKIIVNLQKNLSEKEHLPWWKQYFGEMVIGGVSLLGWVFFALFFSSVLRRPLLVQCCCKKNIPEKLSETPLGDGFPRASSSEEISEHSKNKTTNWWV